MSEILRWPSLFNFNECLIHKGRKSVIIVQKIFLEFSLDIFFCCTIMRSLAAINNGVEPLPALDVASAGQQSSDNSDSEMAGAQDTIYLCNFRVSVDGEWLCLKELHDMEMQDSFIRPSDSVAITSPDDPMHSLLGKLQNPMKFSTGITFLKITTYILC